MYFVQRFGYIRRPAGATAEAGCAEGRGAAGALAQAARSVYTLLYDVHFLPFYLDCI